MQTQENALSHRPQGAMAQVSHQDEILRSDIIVPFLTLVQELSDLKKEGLARAGDIAKNKTGEKYGDPDHPVDVVFLHAPKNNWILEEKPANKTRFEYRKTIDRNAKNETLDWSYWADVDGNEVPVGTRGATEWRRVKQSAVFALALKDIDAFLVEKKKVASGEMPDPNKALMPFMISFRGSSYQAAREVISFLAKCRMFPGATIHGYSMPLGAKLVEDEDNSYYTFTVDASKAKGLSKDHQEIVKEWVSLMNAGKLQVEEEPADAVETQVSAKPAQKPLKNYAPQS